MRLLNLISIATTAAAVSINLPEVKITELLNGGLARVQEVISDATSGHHASEEFTQSVRDDTSIKSESTSKVDDHGHLALDLSNELLEIFEMFSKKLSEEFYKEPEQDPNSVAKEVELLSNNENGPATQLTESIQSGPGEDLPSQDKNNILVGEFEIVSCETVDGVLPSLVIIAFPIEVDLPFNALNLSASELEDEKQLLSLLDKIISEGEIEAMKAETTFKKLEEEIFNMFEKEINHLNINDLENLDKFFSDLEGNQNNVGVTDQENIDTLNSKITDDYATTEPTEQSTNSYGMDAIICMYNDLKSVDYNEFFDRVYEDPAAICYVAGGLLGGLVFGLVLVIFKLARNRKEQGIKLDEEAGVQEVEEEEEEEEGTLLNEKQ